MRKGQKANEFQVRARMKTGRRTGGFRPLATHKLTQYFDADFFAVVEAENEFHALLPTATIEAGYRLLSCLPDCRIANHSGDVGKVWVLEYDYRRLLDKIEQGKFLKGN